MARQDLPYFVRQPTDRGVVEIRGKSKVFLRFPTGDLILLPVDVSGVLRLDLNLLRGLALQYILSKGG